MLYSLVTEKVKKSGKAKKTDKHAASIENNMERHVEVSAANVDGTADVDEIPSVDEDCSRGMKSKIFSLLRSPQRYILASHYEVTILHEMCLMGKKDATHD
jgi:hypothetical protein